MLTTWVLKGGVSAILGGFTRSVSKCDKPPLLSFVWRTNCLSSWWTVGSLISCFAVCGVNELENDGVGSIISLDVIIFRTLIYILIIWGLFQWMHNFTESAEFIFCLDVVKNFELSKNTTHEYETWVKYVKFFVCNTSLKMDAKQILWAL